MFSLRSIHLCFCLDSVLELQEAQIQSLGSKYSVPHEKGTLFVFSFILFQHYDLLVGTFDWYQTSTK